MSREGPKVRLDSARALVALFVAALVPVTFELFRANVRPLPVEPRTTSGTEPRDAGPPAQEAGPASSLASVAPTPGASPPPPSASGDPANAGNVPRPLAPALAASPPAAPGRELPAGVPSASQPPAREVVKRLRDSLAGATPGTRAALLDRELAPLGERRRARVLLQLLAASPGDGEDRELVRAELIERLGPVATSLPEVSAELAKSLAPDRPATERRAALAALANAPALEPVAERALEDMARGDADPVIAREARRVLETAGTH